jgi:eukaryotic-like serine/threonine-protein kinase
MTGVDAAAGMPLRPTDPTEFGPYRLLRRLGEGGMGSVYLAAQVEGEPQDIGRLVAIKVIRSDLAHEPDFRRRFRGEVARAQQVPPFCTAEVLDADADHDPPYLVVEYVDGPTLAAVVQQRGPLSPANLHGLAIGVATALTGIHGAGVIHRDLKPANVLLAPGTPKVIDFGIARGGDGLTVGHTGPDEVIGTIAYMAPERLDPAGSGRLTSAADIFAWGAVVTYAGTGRTPFGGGSAEAAVRILTQPPDLGGLTGPLRELVAAALQKDPALRPTSRELLDRLLSAGPRAATAQPGPVTTPPTNPAGALILEGSRQALVSVPQPETVQVRATPTEQVEPAGPPIRAADPAAAPPAGPTAPQLLQERLTGDPTAARGGRTGRRLAVSALVLTLLALSGAVAGLATGLIEPVNLFAEPQRSPSAAPISPAAQGATSPSPSMSPSPSLSPSTSPSPAAGLELFQSGQVVLRDSLAKAGIWTPITNEVEKTTCSIDGALTVERGKAGSFRCPGLRDQLTDVAVTVEVTLATPGSCAGLWLRYTDAGGGYALRICQDAVELVQHGLPGQAVIVTLSTFRLTEPIELNRPVRIGVTAKESQINVFLNEQRTLSRRYTTFSQGRVVLGTFTVLPADGVAPPPPYRVVFRDIEIRDLTQ